MSPADLIPITRRVLQHIHQVFYGKGLQINYAKGKTEAVVMFRGPEADRRRLDFFSETQDTYITTSTDTHVFRVRAVASYKHLGVRFQMDADLDHELQCRLGQARTAFHEVRRPIFGNRRISCKARLQLLQSLVFSKLLYGSGTWYEVSRRVLQKLESAVMRYFRSVVGVGFWQDERLTDDDIRAKFQIPTLRTMVAVARLRFLKHVASHGHDYHRDLLIAERATTKGWLYEVEDDLRWMASCSDLSSMPVIPGSSDMWSPFFDWLRTSTPSWKSWIRRTMRMHYLRENLAGECKSFHAQMFQMLRDNGAVLHEPVLETDSAPKHACPECEALFDTATGVAVHRAKKHGIHCPIKDYVQSETCPGCLKHMWTSQRVIQHLRYRPNRCLDRVVAGRTPQGFQNVSLPPHLLKVKRLPAHRRAHGPLLPLPHERERTQVRERLRVCEAYGNDRDFWSPVSANLQAHANERLTAAAQKWLREDSGDGDQFISNLLDAIAGFPFPHLVSEKCVIKWIESVMWDAMADWPPDALHIVETVHLPFIQGIPLWAHQNERAHLTRLLQSTAAPINWDPMHFAPAPHPKKQRRATSVHTLYGQLAQDEARWKDIVMSRLPPSPLTKMHIAETYYVVHLYSGRRRKQDLQWYLESAFHAVAGSTRILSIDTAVDAMCDVNADETWSMLCELARSGRLLAIVLGPPCETWSSARHELLMDPHGNPLPGPRPLRSSFRPWGIDSLSAKEYRQIRMGMRLLLRGLLLSLMTVLSGGSAILEHPAQPKQTDRASIWRTAVVTLLLQSGLFRQFTFVQWKFGGVGIKPTTLLYGNIPRLPAIMKSKEDPSAIRPTTSLVGTSHDGSFRTGRAKEYPTGMNDALASCIADQWLPYLEGPLGVQQLLCQKSELLRFLSEEQAAAVSSTLQGGNPSCGLCDWFGQQIDPSSSSEDTRAALEAARARPGDWVLKPQVEGSGELFFDEDIPRPLVLAKGGSLFDGLLKQFEDGHMPPKEVRHLMKGILEAVGHIHQQGMLHRDIKPDNLVMRRDDVWGEPGSPKVDGSGKGLRVAIIDFDHADPDYLSKCSKQSETPSDYFCGTVQFSAPEAFFGSFSPASDLHHSLPSDGWEDAF
eukprot:symbB.v1.2.014218.t1/scaffold1036.1/size142803/5